MAPSPSTSIAFRRRFLSFKLAEATRSSSLRRPWLPSMSQKRHVVSEIFEEIMADSD